MPFIMKRNLKAKEAETEREKLERDRQHNLVYLLELRRDNLGFHYLKEILNNKEYNITDIGNVRILVATKFDTTPSRVERAIRHLQKLARISNLGYTTYMSQKAFIAELQYLMECKGYIFE